MAKRLMKFAVLSALSLLGLVVLAPYGLYWYGLSGLPRDLAPSREVVASAVIRTVWAAETKSTDVVMEPTTVWGWIVTFHGDSRGEISPSLRMSSLAARFVGFRESSGERHSTLKRRLTELAAAIWISQHWSAEETTVTLLAESYLGHDFRGVSQASRGYFGLGPQELGVAEALVLAGLLRAPSILDPWCKPERARLYAEELADRLVLGDIPAPRLLPVPEGACPLK